MNARTIWFNGSCVPWEEARVHVWDELALRGASVFEGMVAIWDEVLGGHRVLALQEHLDRLMISAELTDIAVSYSRDEVCAALAEVSATLTGVDVYLRPTLYAMAGRSTLSDNSAGGMYIGGFPYRPSAPPRLTATVSSLRRFGGPISALAKAGGAYLDFRLYERERIARGADHVLILNEDECLAEADGAAVLLIQDGVVLSPSVDTGLLDSITKRILLEIAGELGLRVVERRIRRDELAGAQVVLAGTLIGLRVLDEIDGRGVLRSADTSIAHQLVEEYRRLLNGEHVLSKTFLTPLPKGGS